MIDFLKYTKFYFVFSGILLSVALFSIFYFGLKPSIDFTGGGVMEVSSNYSIDGIQSRIDEIQNKATMQISFIQEVKLTKNTESTNQYIYQIKSKELNAETKGNLLSAMQSLLTQEDAQVSEQSFEFIGPVLGKELIVKTIISIVIVALILLYYISKQFNETIFGLAAIVALIHDTTVVLGAFAILGYLLNAEIDLLFVTAILTTLSFSLHDTIVVFDRIREISAIDSKRNFAESINIALNQTIVRSLNTSILLIILLLSFALLGGITLRFFVLALLIGLVVGTYSSPFIASPVLRLLQVKYKKKV